MKQITIITPPDRPGTVAEIADLLASNDINITDCDATDDHAHGVVLLRAEPYDAALRVLSEAGYTATNDDLLVLKLKDEPGALAKVAAELKEPGLNIRSMRFVRRENGWATVVMATDDNARAREFLAEFVVG